MSRRFIYRIQGSYNQSQNYSQIDQTEGKIQRLFHQQHKDQNIDITITESKAQKM